MNYIEYATDDWNKEYKNGYGEYLEKEEIRYSCIAEMVRSDKCNSLLDLGCGTGILEKYVDNNIVYYGIDISNEAIDRAKKEGHGRYINSDLIGYIPPLSFDVIVFNESLYYLYKPIDILKHYCNYLNKDGRIIISVYQPDSGHRYYQVFSSLVNELQDSFSVLAVRNISNDFGLNWKLILIGNIKQISREENK